MSTQDFNEIIDPAQLEKIKQSNLDRLEALANQGITLSVGDLAFLKMEALIDVFLPEQDQKRKLEMVVEQKKKEIIDQVMAEIRKQTLMEGVAKNANKLNLRK